MREIVQGISLDEENKAFLQAVELVQYTNKMFYLTGKAGTGKTTFLKYICKETNKNTVVLAPTGVAAVNAGGVTIHSFFGIPPSIFVPGDKRLREIVPPDDEDKTSLFKHFRYNAEKREIIREMELLIIDEISMVRCDLMDVIDAILKVYRKNSAPFGGVQVLLIGDTFQLPPIARPEDWHVLGQFYKSPFFFSSRVIEQNAPFYIELQKIYRQNEQDFIDLLNRIRVNQLNQTDLMLLNSKVDAAFEPQPNENYITLATHNRMVDDINRRHLQALEGEEKLFEAVISGTFPDSSLPTDKVLKLKPGAQVMFNRNDKHKRYYNGKIGKVVEMTEVHITVRVDNGEEIRLGQEEWRNVRYTWDAGKRTIEEEEIGTFRQFPLKLAWAVTVHKSQGLTFEHVIADLGSAFAPGQVYVALSRCTSFNGLVLKSTIGRRAISTDSNVLKFAQKTTPETLVIAEVDAGKADDLYRKSRGEFDSGKIEDAVTHLLSARKLRNDTGTERFKRIMVVLISRLWQRANLFNQSQQNLKMALKNVKQLEKKTEQLQLRRDELKEEIRAYKKDMKAIQRKLQSAEKKMDKKKSEE